MCLSSYYKIPNSSLRKLSTKKEKLTINKYKSTQITKKKPDFFFPDKEICLTTNIFCLKVSYEDIVRKIMPVSEFALVFLLIFSR